MRRFDRQFAWQRNFMRQMKRICGEYLTTEASFEEDARHNTDLIVLGMQPHRVACRVRRYEKYRAKYGDEFTIRADTELRKIRDGWGDYLLYGFGREQNWSFMPWTLADLDVFRDCYRPGMGTRKPNTDGGSDLLAFRWSDFPDKFIVAKSWRQGGLFGEAG